MTSSNIKGGFEGSCIWPRDKKKALTKIRSQIEISPEEEVTNLFSDILTIPQQISRPQQDIPMSLRYKTILTSTEYIQIAKQQKADQEKRQKDKEERKAEREKRKKEGQE